MYACMLRGVAGLPELLAAAQPEESKVLGHTTSLIDTSLTEP